LVSPLLLAKTDGTATVLSCERACRSAPANPLPCLCGNDADRADCCDEHVALDVVLLVDNVALVDFRVLAALAFTLAAAWLLDHEDAHLRRDEPERLKKVFRSGTIL
jgi:hypothetical protein